jgi:hypothetical protein
MKAVQRIFHAWRRFFFASGVFYSVILKFADSDWHSPEDRLHPAASAA